MIVEESSPQWRRHDFEMLRLGMGAIVELVSVSFRCPRLSAGRRFFALPPHASAMATPKHGGAHGESEGGISKAGHTMLRR